MLMGGGRPGGIEVPAFDSNAARAGCGGEEFLVQGAFGRVEELVMATWPRRAKTSSVLDPPEWSGPANRDEG